MDIITRKDALTQGLTHYFTGKPCKRGHIVVRYVKTRSCIECTAGYNAAFYAANPGKSTEYSRRWQVKNPNKVKAIEARRIRQRTDAIRTRELAYRQRTRESRRSYCRQWQANRKAVDPQFRLRSNLASLINTSIRKQFGNKASRTQDLISCTIAELRQHLEVQFTDGMSWDNYGRNGWHIDHIRPCASFDLTDPEQQRQCFHYTNLQPLWAADNISKGAKWQDPA
jgi:hypothetical protein